MRLARSVPVPVAIPPLTVEPPLRVLVIVTYPGDEARPNVYAEIDAISARLRAAPYQLTVLSEPTMENLFEALQQETHIVHYVGHAGLDRGEGNLILHDSRGSSRWISAAELSKVLPPTVRLLCLSTCVTVPNYQILGLTRLACAAASYRLPTTIANRYAVSEAGVRRFWEVFYDRLPAVNFSASEACHAAQQAVAVKTGGGTDWGSFSLVIRDQLGEPFRLEQPGGRSESRHFLETQAAMTSQVANDLAEALESFGPDAPESLRSTFEEQAGKADALAADLE